MVIDAPGSVRVELAAGLTLVPVAHEAVLVDAHRGDLHALNPPAATICAAADGRTLDELVAVCVARFDASAGTIDAEVRRGVAALRDAGLLDLHDTDLHGTGTRDLGEDMA